MAEIPEFNDAILVVLDAHCMACASGARWIAKRDRDQKFRIVPMQSRLGQDLFRKYGLDPDDPASWLCLEDGKPLTGLEAWARVGRVLGGSARVLGLLMVLPKPLRAGVYSFVVRNRIRFFGTADLCTMPDPVVASPLLQ
ncbi:MAG: DUF393 domain-containing protein [Silicimonas sp.]|nr:DUF393 domain-containing protein [Silicimonas sp.]